MHMEFRTACHNHLHPVLLKSYDGKYETYCSLLFKVTTEIYFPSELIYTASLSSVTPFLHSLVTCANIWKASL